MKRLASSRSLAAPLSLGLLAASLVGLLASGASVSDDGSNWPQWRGPNLDGISQETGWSVEGKTEPLWEKNVGLGYSTVSIQDGRLYTVGHLKEYEEDLVLCLDAKSGEVIWEHPFPAKTWDKMHGGGTLTTPSVNAERVFVFGREGVFLCLDAKTGEVQWEKQLYDDFELVTPMWAFSGSPLLLEKMVVINVGIVLAYDHDGELLWKSEKDYGHAYSTPAVFDHEGTSCLAVFNGGGLAILESKSGKELAFFEWKTRYDVNAATPIIIGSQVFISSGYNHGCAMLEFTGSALEVLWSSKVMRTQMSGCAVWEDHLYGVDEDILKCIDLEGNEKWANEEFGKGAIVLAGGKIIGMSAAGELVIAEAKPDGYQELLRRPVLEGGVYWTTPVLLDGLIYGRNSEGDLVCLDHRSKDD
jgi:outer membrane protein assembly factor BamB